MIFEILEKKLTDSGLVVPGQTLFRNFMGAEIQSGVLLRAPLTGIPIDPYIEGRHKTDIQVITRHVDPVDGMALAISVSRTLLVETLEHFTFDEGDASISMFYPKALPIQFPRLEGNGLEFSQHFLAVYSFTPGWR